MVSDEVIAVSFGFKPPETPALDQSHGHVLPGYAWRFYGDGGLREMRVSIESRDEECNVVRSRPLQGQMICELFCRNGHFQFSCDQVVVGFGVGFSSFQ